tara:strand:+ start:397 stop:1821 length:1425 start_codon:yes stop_codon:yes gene_type:complete
MMNVRFRIGLINASLPSYFPRRHGVFEAAEKMLADLTADLGIGLVSAPDLPMDARAAQQAVDHCRAEGAGFILLLHGGFTMGDVARQIAASDLPMGVWATPEPSHEGDIQLNSFVSLNMTMSIARGVRDLRHAPVQWYFGAPSDAALRARLRQTLMAVRTAHGLKGSHVGLVGGLAPTFYNMDVSQAGLMSALGVAFAHVDMHEMTGRMDAADAAEVGAEVADMAAAAEIRGVSGDQMALTARAALALRAIAGDHGFDALAVSDWPALQQAPGMHPGAAFSWIEEQDNLPVASEGDVMGAVTQMAVREMTGRVGCLLDMTSPQMDRDRILMWHGGGGPLYMARDRAAWINHPMIGRGTAEGPRFGAIADFEFGEGPQTVLRLARDGDAFFAIEGDVVRAEESGFTGCRGWVSNFSDRSGGASAASVVTSVMEHGLEHHFVMVPGRWRDAFEEFGGWSGMKRLALIAPHAGLADR